MIQTSTKTFKISRTELLRHAVGQISPVAWCVAAGVLLAGTVLAITVDWRWAMVAAMLLLALVPALMAFLFFNYALSPRCLPQTYPHTVTFDNDGFKIQATVPPLAPLKEEETTESKPTHIGYSATYGDVRKASLGIRGLTLILRSKPPGILIIPHEMLPKHAPISEILAKCVNN